MKAINTILFVAMFSAGSLLSGTFAATPQRVPAKADLKKTLDSIDNALKQQDAKTYVSFLTEDGLYLGSDPKEYWDKAAFAKMMNEMMASRAKETSNKETFKYDKREVRMSKDGNSAIVVSEFMAYWSKIPVRDVSHFIKVGNRWMIDFSSVALIPKNEDLDKLSKAVMP